MNPLRALRRLLFSQAVNDSASVEGAVNVDESDAIDAHGLDKASKHWGEKAQESVTEHVPSSWTECPIVLEEYINPAVSLGKGLDWLTAISKDYFPEPVNKALSLGCGGGGLERHGLLLQMAKQFDAFDVSAEAINIARAEAAKYDVTELLRYDVANLNLLEFTPSTYGAVFASQSVHHIENLEHYMSQVNCALIDDGLFVVNEFIGPNQFQWTDAQLHYAQKMLESIPVKYRQNIREEGVRESIVRPTIEAMNDYDPTEAIRSEDIIPEMEKHFEIVDRRDFGGTLLHLVLDNIAGNLSQDEEGKAVLRNMFVEEQRLIAEGEIQNDFTILVARKKAR